VLVADIMTTAAVTTLPEARAKDALRELSDREITALPVVDHDNHLVGIVSEADLLREGVVRDPRSSVRRDEYTGALPVETARTVGEVMSRHVITASPTQDVATVVGTMLDHGVHSVPVVLGARVVGMVSRSDVVRALARADERIAADVVVLLRDAGLDGWDCTVEEGEVRLVAGSPDDTRLAAALARTVTGVRSIVVEPALR
jgi:CBS domain-containing protein